MTVTSYNPDSAPDASEWLALPVEERVRLVQNFHVAARAQQRSMKAHAALHVAVEGMVASGYGPSKKAMARLVSQGLSRHEAVHAIGSVVARFLTELNQAPTREQQASFQSRMGEAIHQLNAQDDLS